MRLVDADKLLEKWNELSVRGRTEFDQVIMTMPTAYDVEKVVEQLDEKSQLARPVGWVYPYEIILTKDVMKIIKAGGIDEASYRQVTSKLK